MAEDNDRSFPTSFWLDVETRKILDELIAERGSNRSSVVREAIRLMRVDVDQEEIRRLVAELSRVVSGR